MMTDEFHDYFHQYTNIQTVDADTERCLAKDMDDALTELAILHFESDSRLEAIMAHISSEWPFDHSLDQLLTQYDLAVLVRMFPERFDEQYSELKQSLAKGLFASKHDRTIIHQHLFSKLSGHQHDSEDVSSVQNKYVEARNKLVQANMRLVMHLARRYGGKGVELEELVQDGTIGLIKATERYNLNKGFRFTTYAYWWIQQAIKESLSDKRGVVRLPGNINERILKIDRTKQSYFKEHGRFPRHHEIQRITGLDSHHISAVEGIGNLSDSVNEPIYEDGLSLEETLEPEDAILKTPDYIQSQRSDRIWVNSLLTKLPERQQFILRLYHGIDIGKTYPFREIAPQLGITLERTRQLYHESIRSLKELAVGECE